MDRVRGRLTTAVMALLFLVAHRTATGADATITLTDRASIAGPRVALGALARIDASDPELAQRLDQVPVGLAPAPGKSRVMARAEVEEALALAGVPPWTVTIGGALQIEITRLAQSIRQADLDRLLREAFAEETGVASSELDLAHVQYLQMPTVGGGRIELKAEFLTPPVLSRMVQARVAVFVDGVPTARVDAELEMARRAPVVASVAPPDPGRPRRTPSRRRERLVKRGQHVTLELEGPGLQITATGKARSNGYLDDEVTVENSISGILVRGVVKGAGLVRVYWSPSRGLDGAR